MSLCKLLQHAIESNDSRLQDFEVKGDQVQSESSGVRTRSKTSKGMLEEVTLRGGGGVSQEVKNSHY